MWVQLIWYVVATLLTIALAPRPPSPTAAALSDFTVPTADETRSIPWLFGTRLITGPNVVGYTGLRVDPIHKSTIFSTTTIAFKYNLVLHMVMCSAPIDYVSCITAGGKLMWSGHVTGNSTVNINLPNLFGGEGSAGGIHGDIDFCFGATNQAVNPVLAANYGDVPAYRNVFGLVFHDTNGGNGPGYVGTQPQIQPWAIQATRIVSGWYQGNVWYSTKAAVGSGGDMNAAHIIYQVLTDPNQGLGMSTLDVNDTNFKAIADELFAEGLGISLLWQESVPVNDFIQTIVDHIGGGLTLNPSTGLYELMLFRGGYDVSTLPVFDQTNVKALVSYQKQAWGDTVNEIVLQYTIPPGENSPITLPTNNTSSLTLQDVGNIEAQGTIVTQTISYPGIRNDALARAVAGRELATRCTPLSKVTLDINRSAWSLGFGSLFVLNWPTAPGIAGVVFRAVRVAKSDLSGDNIQVDAVQDVFALGSADYVASATVTPTPSSVVLNDADPPNSGPTVISSTLTAPPANAQDGDRYLIPPGASGVWQTHVGQIAVRNESVSPATWDYLTVPPGVLIYDNSIGSYNTIIGGVPTDAGIGGQISKTAAQITYDHFKSGLLANNVQDALDQIALRNNDGYINVKAFANNLWFAQSSSFDFYDATDGITFTLRTTQGQTSLNSLIVFSAHYLAVRTNAIGHVATTDIYSANWTWVTTAINPARVKVLNGNLYAWSAVGSAVIKSTDSGATWPLVSAGVTPYGTIVLADTPAGWWRMGDDIDFTRDSSGNKQTARTGDLVHSSSYQANLGGLVGEGVAWATVSAGSNQPWYEPRTAAGGPLALFVGTADFSIEFWIEAYLAVPASDGLFLFTQNNLEVASGTTYASVQVLWDQSTKTIHFVNKNGPVAGGTPLALSVGGTTNLFDGAPHHVVCTRGASGRASIYIDGTQVANRSSGTVCNIPAAATAFGTVFGNIFGGGGVVFSAVFDEIALYTAELSSTRVTAHWNAGSDGLQPNLAIVEVIYDTTNSPNRFVVFANVPYVGTAGNSLRPQVFVSKDLVTIKPQATLGPSPFAENVQMMGVVQNGATVVVLLQRLGSSPTTYLYKSTDGGSTFTLVTGVSWPVTPFNSATSIAYDGTVYIVTGQAWAATSPDLVTWTFAGGGSNLPALSTYTLYSNGAGITSAAILRVAQGANDFTATGLRGTMKSTDGLTWQVAPKVTILASQVAFDNSNGSSGAVNVQTALEDALGIWGILRNRIFGD